MSEVTVLLADPQIVTRHGVRRVLEAHGLRVVGDVGSAPDAVASALAHRPDVCLLSVHMPGGGITAAEQIAAQVPETKVVMLTASDSDEDLFGALRAGAVGYLLKSTSVERLPHAILGVIEGEAALPRDLTAHVLREFRAAGPPRRVSVEGPNGAIELTGREFEVAQLLRQHKSTSEIATALQISDVTVRRHISTILHKFGVSDRQSALKLLGHWR